MSDDQPDIVDELDRWLSGTLHSVASALNVSATSEIDCSMVQRARDEIVALRKGWLDQAARDAAEIVRLERVLEDAIAEERERCAQLDLRKVIREEVDRQYREDERRKCPAGVSYYETDISPYLIAEKIAAAIRKEPS